MKQKPTHITYISNVDVGDPSGPGVNEREFVVSVIGSDVESLIYLAGGIPSLQQDGVDVTAVRAIRGGAILCQFSMMFAMAAFMANRKSNSYIIMRLPPLPFLLMPLFMVVGRYVHIKTMGPVGQNWSGGSKLRALPSIVQRALALAHHYSTSFVCRRARSLDACTPQICENLRLNIVGLPPVYHIPNGVNVKRFVPPDPFVKTKNDVLVVGYLGGLPSERGAYQIIRCIRQLRSEGQNVVGLIVGTERVEAIQLSQYARELNCDDYVEILGKIEFASVPEMMKKIDIGVALDRPEKVSEFGSSNQKIRQYLAMGKPCIVPAGSHPEEEERMLALGADYPLESIVEPVKRAIRILQSDVSFGVASREFSMQNYSVELLTDKRYRILMSPEWVE